MAEIVIENLYKSFDTKDGTVEALKNVNLSIESGDIYGIIGMSGAGKSTLVRCINFLEVPTKGRVLINGKSLGDYTSRELRKMFWKMFVFRCIFRESPRKMPKSVQRSF